MKPFLPAIGMLFTLGVMIWAWPRSGDLPQAVACCATAFLMTLLTGKQAFLNYYWFCNALFLVAAFLRYQAQSSAAEVVEAPELGAAAASTRTA